MALKERPFRAVRRLIKSSCSCSQRHKGEVGAPYRKNKTALCLISYGCYFSRLEYLRLNFSILPAVSIIFCFPVKNG